MQKNIDSNILDNYFEFDTESAIGSINEFNNFDGDRNEFKNYVNNIRKGIANSDDVNINSNISNSENSDYNFGYVLGTNIAKVTPMAYKELNITVYNNNYFLKNDIDKEFTVDNITKLRNNPGYTLVVNNDNNKYGLVGVSGNLVFGNPDDFNGISKFENLDFANRYNLDGELINKLDVQDKKVTLQNVQKELTSKINGRYSTTIEDNFIKSIDVIIDKYSKASKQLEVAENSDKIQNIKDSVNAKLSELKNVRDSIEHRSKLIDNIGKIASFQNPSDYFNGDTQKENEFYKEVFDLSSKGQLIETKEAYNDLIASKNNDIVSISNDTLFETVNNIKQNIVQEDVTNNEIVELKNGKQIWNSNGDIAFSLDGNKVIVETYNKEIAGKVDKTEIFDIKGNIVVDTDNDKFSSYKVEDGTAYKEKEIESNRTTYYDISSGDVSKIETTNKDNIVKEYYSDKKLTSVETYDKKEVILSKNEYINGKISSKEQYEDGVIQTKDKYNSNSDVVSKEYYTNNEIQYRDNYDNEQISTKDIYEDGKFSYQVQFDKDSFPSIIVRNEEIVKVDYSDSRITKFSDNVGIVFDNEGYKLKEIIYNDDKIDTIKNYDKLETVSIEKRKYNNDNIEKIQYYDCINKFEKPLQTDTFNNSGDIVRVETYKEVNIEIKNCKVDYIIEDSIDKNNLSTTIDMSTDNKISISKESENLVPYENIDIYNKEYFLEDGDKKFNGIFDDDLSNTEVYIEGKLIDNIYVDNDRIESGSIEDSNTIIHLVFDDDGNIDYDDITILNSEGEVETTADKFNIIEIGDYLNNIDTDNVENAFESISDNLFEIFENVDKVVVKKDIDLDSQLENFKNELLDIKNEIIERGNLDSKDISSINELFDKFTPVNILETVSSLVAVVEPDKSKNYIDKVSSLNNLNRVEIISEGINIIKESSMWEKIDKVDSKMENDISTTNLTGNDSKDTLEAEKHRFKDTGYRRDTIDAHHRLWDKVDAYKKGVEYKGKVPTRIDIIIEAINVSKTNIIETLIIRALDAIFDTFEKNKQVKTNDVDTDKDNIESSNTQNDTEIEDEDYIDNDLTDNIDTNLDYGNNVQDDIIRNENLEFMNNLDSMF